MKRTKNNKTIPDYLPNYNKCILNALSCHLHFHFLKNTQHCQFLIVLFDNFFITLHHSQILFYTKK